MLQRDAGQGGDDPKRVFRLQYVEGRFPCGAAGPTGDRNEELAMQPLGAIEHLAGFVPHPDAGIAWRHCVPSQTRSSKGDVGRRGSLATDRKRSEEHTSELQSLM